MPKRTRRTFLKTAAALAPLAAAPVMSAQSQDKIAGANRRVRVGLIGCGGMGGGDLRAMLRLGAECVALCDVDDEQTAKTRASVEKNFTSWPRYS